MRNISGLKITRNTRKGRKIESIIYYIQRLSFRYPIMFTGTMQDQIFLERHFCQKPWDSISANKLSWWIKAINEVKFRISEKKPFQFHFWLQP